MGVPLTLKLCDFELSEELLNMDQELKNRIDGANAGHANEEEAFERMIDSLVQLPAHIKPTPDCSWCNWRRGDSPRNLKFCGYHQTMRNRIRG